MKSPFMASLTHPMNMGMLGLILFAGLLIDWRLALVGLVFYVIMLLVMARYVSEMMEE